MKDSDRMLASSGRLITRDSDLAARLEHCMKLHIFIDGIGLFRHIFFSFFFLFCESENATLSPHDCVIFHWSLLLHQVLLLRVMKSIGSAVRQLSSLVENSYLSHTVRIMKINGCKFASQRKFIVL